MVDVDVSSLGEHGRRQVAEVVITAVLLLGRRGRVRDAAGRGGGVLGRVGGRDLLHHGAQRVGGAILRPAPLLLLLRSLLLLPDPALLLRLLVVPVLLALLLLLLLLVLVLVLSKCGFRLGGILVVLVRKSSHSLLELFVVIFTVTFISQRHVRQLVQHVVAEGEVPDHRDPVPVLLAAGGAGEGLLVRRHPVEVLVVVRQHVVLQVGVILADLVTLGALGAVEVVVCDHEPLGGEGLASLLADGHPAVISFFSRFFLSSSSSTIKPSMLPFLCFSFSLSFSLCLSLLLLLSLCLCFFIFFSSLLLSSLLPDLLRDLFFFSPPLTGEPLRDLFLSSFTSSLGLGCASSMCSLRAAPPRRISWQMSHTSTSSSSDILAARLDLKQLGGQSQVLDPVFSFRD